VGGRAERPLGHGPLVGVEHDADRRALAGGAGGRGAGGGGGQQLGEQRVLLAQGLVRHDRDLAVPRRGDQGDDAAALEEARRERQRHHELPDGHGGQHVVHQVGRALVHPPPDAARAHSITNLGSVRPRAASVHCCSKVSRFSRTTR